MRKKQNLRYNNTYGLVVILLLFLLASCRNNENTITVETKDGLQVDNVEIKYGFVSINRESDSELFSKNMTPVFDGKDKENLSTIFGENDFLMVYDDKYYYSFRHFIESDFKNDYPKGHNYNFLLYKRNDTIFCDIDIQGEIPMKFTRFMSGIETADIRLGNTPKENAGVIFNMKEMEPIDYNQVDTLIKNTQGKIKTDCFYDFENYRLYFSQLSLNKYCDSILNQNQSDSLFYKKLKGNCIKMESQNNVNFALELLLTQEIKIRDLQTNNWTSSIILTSNLKNEWSVKGLFVSDTVQLIKNTKAQHGI